MIKLVDLLKENESIDTIRKVVNGFELTRYTPGFGLSFKTKNGTASPILIKRINSFIKDTLLVNNVDAFYEKTYKTINFIIKNN